MKLHIEVNYSVDRHNSKLFFGSCLSRRYDGNPYSKLRERNKRDVVEEEKGIEIGETLEIGDAEEFDNRNKGRLQKKNQ